jgi:hypothetical protein
MEMPQKMFSVRAEDIVVGSIFYSDDYENGNGIVPFKLLAPMTEKNGVIILKVLNLNMKQEQDFLINKTMPREIFLDKLNTNWRRI